MGAWETPPLTPRDAALPWTRRDASLLLRRVSGGGTAVEVDRIEKEGLSATLDRWLKPQPESADFEREAGLLLQSALAADDIGQLKSWWLYRLLHSANPVVEKMTLLWHNHFATSHAKVQSTLHMHNQNALFRTHAIGDFRKLLHGVSRDVAMLIWLDGNANRKRHPNENFAREVMELFSLGVGNYTEQDIVEAARAFTGWHVRDDAFWFNTLQHDEGTKTVLGKSGAFNGSDIIDLCLDHPACSRFLAFKLLREFVTAKPGDEEIAAVAGRITAHRHQIAPVLRELFGSEMFYSAANQGRLVKSPIDLTCGAVRTLCSRVNLESLAAVNAELGQDLFLPATVKGWEGGRLWINSTTWLLRLNFAADISAPGGFVTLDPALLSKLTSLPPGDQVSYCRELLLGRDVSPETETQIAAYQSEASGTPGLRVRGLLRLILSLPEYQLS